MSNQYEPLIPATPALDTRGVPQSTLYGDVYHPAWGAMEQAKRVFLHGNQIPERWQGKESFTVCETGFGLGHNFLALWNAWRDDPLRPARLHMLSFEGHPFSASDLASLLLPRMDGPELELAQALVSAWPPLLPGMHRLEFDEGAVTLTLAFGKVERLARQVEAKVDAFFLDGFAPRVNPEMWSRRLFGQLARMATPDATAATWCCVGEVRRALSAAGFIVNKVPGYGGKRETTVARLRPGVARMDALNLRPRPKSVVIVGGGLAGAGVAQALSLRGVSCTILDPVFAFGLGASHKGHLAAALTPSMSRDDDVRSRLSRAGALRALARWQGFDGAARPQRCGTLEVIRDVGEARRWQKVLATLNLPAEWVSWLEADQVQEVVGIDTDAGGIWFREGMLIRMEPLIAAMLESTMISCLPLNVARVGRDAAGIWSAYGPDGSLLASAEHLVLANASGVPTLVSGIEGVPLPSKLRGLYKMGGQVTYLSEPAALNNRAILAGNGYCLPAVDGTSVVGSTYLLQEGAHAMTEAGHAENLLKLDELLGRRAPRRPELSTLRGWAGSRAAVADRLPVVGAVPGIQNLWLACAYGSRGLSWSALAGDVIAAMMLNEPIPLERDLLQKIAPR